MEKEVEGTGMREGGPKRWPERGSRGQEGWWGEELEGGLEGPVGDGDRDDPQAICCCICSYRWIWTVGPVWPLKTLGHRGAVPQRTPVSQGRS